MSNHTAHVQFTSSDILLDLACPECDAHIHAQTDGLPEVVCARCGTRFAIGRLQMHQVDGSHYDSAALPLEAADVCEEMDAAGGLTELEREAVIWVLDLGIAPSDLEPRHRRAIIEWAKKSR